MNIQLIAKPDVTLTGTSRIANDLYRGFLAAGIKTELTFSPQAMIPGVVKTGLKNSRLDLDTFFASYPLHVRLNCADIYHLTNQMLATLLLFQRFPKPVVVTVHDIIPYMVKNQAELNTFRHPAEYVFYRLALSGLRRASALIANSDYTRQTLIDVLRLPPERIYVVYPGLDHGKFRPMSVPRDFWLKYGLQEGERFILYVGSEDPRKNLPTLIRVFAQLKEKMPGIKLIKVGTAHYKQERQKLISMIKAYQLERDVLFTNYVPDEDLPLFYNAAEILIMPSYYEGFGLPVAEAMACGTPAVYTRAGSLPEVAGQAGIQVDPSDSQGMLEALLFLLNNPEDKSRQRLAGLQRAARFTIQNTICATIEVYKRMISDACSLRAVKL